MSGGVIGTGDHRPGATGADQEAPPGATGAAGEPEGLLSLRRGVYVATQHGRRQLVAWPHAEDFGALSEGRLEVLRSLAGGPRHRHELAAVARAHGDEADGDEADGGLAAFLDRLQAGGWLRTTVASAGRPRYTVDPLRPPPPRPTVPAGAVLSRFTVLRRDGTDVVVESPLAWCDVRLHDPAALAVLGTLFSGVGGDGHPAPSGGALAGRLVADLAHAGMATAPGDEEGQLRSRQWGPHELWFHDRSRAGYRSSLGDGFGGTFWARGAFDPLPGRHEPFPGPAIDLHRPDLEGLRRADRPLTAVLEERRSIRAHDEEQPLTAEQLGELLYRCARIRASWTGDGLELSSRPYPAGGAVHELELYPVVRHVRGLAPGLYHYDSYEHQLRLVSPPASVPLRRLLRGAQAASAMAAEPQVLIVVAARVGRLMWKYEGMAYALVLKHVGVLYQTLYCVATAMGLAPCALGSGDSAAFAEATGLDPLVECSVGEFLIGSRQQGTAT